MYFSKSDPMRPGTMLPILTFEGEMGKEYIENDAKKSTIIVWFHPDCEHCLYQLTLINDHIHLLEKVKFFFLTAEKKFPAVHHLGLWPRLTAAENVRFGILEEERFMTSFGQVVTPTMFVFNRQGKLEEKLFGEVKIEKIKRLIDDPIVQEHEKSGLN
jgi:peroxiredoxin